MQFFALIIYYNYRIRIISRNETRYLICFNIAVGIKILIP
jgi:hypothetical protein